MICDLNFLHLKDFSIPDLQYVLSSQELHNKVVNSQTQQTGTIGQFSRQTFQAFAQKIRMLWAAVKQCWLDEVTNRSEAVGEWGKTWWGLPDSQNKFRKLFQQNDISPYQGTINIRNATNMLTCKRTALENTTPNRTCLDVSHSSDTHRSPVLLTTKWFTSWWQKGILGKPVTN